MQIIVKNKDTLLYDEFKFKCSVCKKGITSKKIEGDKKTPKVICGVVEGKKVSPDEVKALANLPSKEALIAQLLSAMNGPTTNFIGALGGLLRKLVGTLDAIKEKKASE